jgi:anti-sigma regulatory factor (Ser/Thr protein kinase)
VTNAERSFGCDHTVPGTARTWVGESVLSMMPTAPGTTHVLDDLEIIVSELVTNSVLAGCSRLHVSLHVTDECVHLEVGDDASGWPTVLEASPSDAHGRGLAIVAALASEWGVRDSGGVKVVWAELPVPGSRATRLP